MVSEPKSDRWTRELASWLIPFAEATGENIKERVKIILKQLSTESAVCSRIYEEVSKVATSRYVNATTGEELNPGALEAERWKRIKEFLANLLPSDKAINPELILKRMTKEKGEHILDFVSRYNMTAKGLTEVSEHRKKQYLIQKLPKTLIIPISIMDVENTNIDDIQKIVKNSTSWQMMQQDGIDDPAEMDIGNIGNEEINVNIKDNGMVELSSIKNMRDFFDTLEHLLKKGGSFRERTERLLRKTQRGRRDDGRQGNQRNLFKQKFPSNNIINENLKEKVEYERRREGRDYEEEEIEEESWQEEKKMFNIEGKDPILMHCPMRIGGKKIKTLVDTGAMTSIMPYHLCKKYGFPINEEKRKTLQGFEGSRIKTEGTTALDVEVAEKKEIHEFEVTKTNKIIAGNDLMKKLRAIPNPGKHAVQFEDSKIIIPCFQCQEGKISNKENQDQKEQNNKILKFEKDAKIPPRWDQENIQIYCNRNFWLRPRETRIVHMPVKCNKRVILHANIHPDLRIETGVQEENQYMKVRISNIGNEMFHITEKTKVGIIEKKKEDRWKYVRDDSTQTISSSKNC